VGEPRGKWRVLQPTRLAVLDRRVTAAAARWPELLEAVVARAVRRARSLAFHMALSHLTRVDERLLALFWDWPAAGAASPPTGSCWTSP
jgi:CRP/FNR family cyclic AMP-dependent transcriptional regulator